MRIIISNVNRGRKTIFKFTAAEWLTAEKHNERRVSKGQFWLIN